MENQLFALLPFREVQQEIVHELGLECDEEPVVQVVDSPPKKRKNSISKSSGDRKLDKRYTLLHEI